MYRLHIILLKLDQRLNNNDVYGVYLRNGFFKTLKNYRRDRLLSGEIGIRHERVVEKKNPEMWSDRVESACERDQKLSNNWRARRQYLYRRSGKK